MITLALVSFFVAQGAVPGTRSLVVNKDNASSHFRIRIAPASLATVHFSEKLVAGSAKVSSSETFSVQETSAQQLNLLSKAKRPGDRAVLTIATINGRGLTFDLFCVDPGDDADAFID